LIDIYFLRLYMECHRAFGRTNKRLIAAFSAKLSAGSFTWKLTWRNKLLIKSHANEDVWTENTDNVDYCYILSLFLSFQCFITDLGVHPERTAPSLF
jgi:hypothetical protein